MKKVSEVVQRGWAVVSMTWLLAMMGAAVALAVNVFDVLSGMNRPMNDMEYLMVAGVSLGLLLASQLPRVVSYIWLGQFKMFPTYD